MNCSQSLGASLVAVMDWSTSERSMDEVEAENEHAAKHTGKLFVLRTLGTHWMHILIYFHVLPWPLYDTLYIPFDDDRQYFLDFDHGSGESDVHSASAPLTNFHFFPYLNRRNIISMLFQCFFSQTWGTAVFINWHYLKCLCNMVLIAILHTEVVH